MYFVIVTCCTCFNMFLGLLALYLAVHGQVYYAAWSLLASVIFDACDGFLARRWNVASEFGAQLDSLADFASFCIAGGALAYYWQLPQAGGEALLARLPQPLMALCAFFFICMGAIRLARYNANTDSLCPPSFFEGIPTTGAAAILAMFCIADPQLQVFNGTSVAVITVLFAYLMVCKLPYPKVTKITWLPKWAWLTPVPVALYSLPAAIWIFCSIYLLSGPVFYFLNKRQHSEVSVAQSE